MYMILGFSEDCCIFPFIYDGVSYNECTTEGEGGLWCATEVYDDGNWKAWKICDETCSGKFYARTHSRSEIAQKNNLMSLFIFDGFSFVSS